MMRHMEEQFEGHFERMRRETYRARAKYFEEMGLEPKDASRLAELIQILDMTKLSAGEQSERQQLMEKYKDTPLELNTT